MIIKISPENEFEAQRIKEVEHTGVKEFFMFGNKKDKDQDLIDFHDWSGSYRYLEGSLYHFLTTVTEEKKTKSHNTNEISIKPQGQIQSPFVKRGAVENPNAQIIDVAALSKQENGQSQPPVIPFLPRPDGEDELIDTTVDKD